MVTQLADAFEQGTLHAGDKVCLGVESTEKEGETVVRLKIADSKAPLTRKKN